MSERFSKIKAGKKRSRQINNVIFGCVGVFIFPIFGTAISKTEIAANQATLLSNLGFIFSLFIIPLVFFGIYKLDRAVERKIPRGGREEAIESSKTEILRKG